MTSYNDLSAEQFRSSLLLDTINVKKTKQSLTVSTGSVVPLEVRSSIGTIFGRWSKLSSSIRQPEYGSVSALINYLDYFIGEMDKWRGREIDKFNKNLNILYSNLGSSSGGLESLISDGSAAQSTIVSSAAANLETQLNGWKSIFPQLLGTGSANSSDKMEEYMHDWRLSAMRGITTLNPHGKMFDPAHRKLEGESAAASYLTADFRIPENWTVPYTDVLNVPRIQVFGDRGLSRSFWFMNHHDTAAANANPPAFEIATIKDGGLRVDYSFADRFENSGTEYVNMNGVDVAFNGVQMPQILSAKLVVLDSAGSKVQGAETDISWGYGESHSVDIPYRSGMVYSICLDFDFTVPDPGGAVHEMFGLWATCEGVVFNGLRSMAIIDSNLTMSGVTPNVIDAIGGIHRPFSSLVWSEDVARTWQLIRMYHGYYKSMGHKTIVDAIAASAVTIGITAPVTTRVMDGDWWLANSSDMHASEKKRLYRHFYELMEDYVIMATTDSGFRRFLSS